MFVACTIFELLMRFQDCQEDVENDSRPGRTSTSKTDDNFEKTC